MFVLSFKVKSVGQMSGEKIFKNSKFWFAFDYLLLIQLEPRGILIESSTFRSLVSLNGESMSIRRSAMIGVRF